MTKMNNVTWQEVNNVVRYLGDDVVSVSGDFSIEENDKLNSVYVVANQTVDITLNDITENRVINIKKISPRPVKKAPIKKVICLFCSSICPV